MAIYLQPCNWHEHDVNFKYMVDVFGRTNEGDIARLRLTGFNPYFYLKAEAGERSSQVIAALIVATKKQMNGMRITEEHKLDAMKGFNGLAPIRVWKLVFPALWMFKIAIRELKNGMRIENRKVRLEDIYESNLPPYLRLFHERDISPASPLKFIADPTNPAEGVRVDICYTCDFKAIEPFMNINIPMYVLSYDIETFSSIPGQFPLATNHGDEVIQIGMSFRWSDDMMTPVEKYVLVSGECTPSTDESVKFISCRNEQDLLLKFQNTIHAENPDVIAGYNTFGFDDGYIAERCQYHRLELQLGREDVTSYQREFIKTEKKTFELASGKYEVRYFDLCGRLPVDLLLVTRREQNLDSYKLDSVASTFLRDKVTDVTQVDETSVEIGTKSTRGLYVGNYVRFDVVTNTYNPYREGTKFKVEQVNAKSFIVRAESPILLDLSDIDRTKLEWCFSKDDIKIEDMFASHSGTPEQRAEVARYCIQDCDLVCTLMAKLDTLVNARGMADVCRVPMDFIFLRGQGIKIFSAVVYNARKRDQIIMQQESMFGDTSYEGAIVLPPKIGLYLDQPIPVLDFNSLYPSNMIAFNISPDTLVYVKTFNTDGKKISHDGPDGTALREAGYVIDEVSYDTHDDAGESTGRTTCGYVQPKEGDLRTIGLLPMTLDILLKKRKETRKQMATTEDDAQIAVLNGLQLAYKVVANSVYGQTGSRTSPIRKMEVAACTTALGRARIYEAKAVVESEFGATVIYGDTDSIFVQFPTKDLSNSIEMAKRAADKITSLCRKPYKIEYEKTFYPFILFCRKRYVGLMYEDDVTKCHRKTMGIAIKRRDNAPIVKDIFGGALDILLEKRDLRLAQTFVKDMLVNVMQNKMPIEKYIITKQLRDDYKNPDQIAHRVLANRMTERDPGNKPQVGDRIPYVYIAARSSEKKQGDKIEHLDYVRKHSLKPDVEFYITNQIQNPVAQLFALGIEQLDGYRSTRDYNKMYETYRETMDEEDSTLAVLKVKEKELDGMMFMGASYLTRHKRGPMDAFLGRK
jgi:DNA polymerase elongation subunit (family B)